MSRWPAPSEETIAAACAAAERGRGRRLAALVKSFSVADLAAAFGRHPDNIRCALSFAAGMKEERAAWAVRKRAVRHLREDEG